ncbi:MAG: iron ABC transporter permease [Deltaproteobacteria bacterium]|nr:iron ABC transporter permease [Deltaproteobacteria bacterium]
MGKRRGVSTKGVSSERNRILALLVLLGGLAGLGLMSMVLGAYDIRPVDVFRTLATHLTPLGDPGGISKLQATIIWDLRFPRVLLDVTVGIALASAGAAFQGCFRNPLVEPYILGVSSGAAFGAALGILFPRFLLSIQSLAFFFSALAVSAAYALGRVRGQTSVVTLILAGIIIGSVFSSLLGILKYTAHDAALREIVFWLLGGFYYATWRDIYLVSPVVIVCFLVMWVHSWKLNVLSMGDEEARALGVNPERYKVLFILLATLATAISVSSVGVIAWVGIMTPHATRMVVGPDHRYVLPFAAMLGGAYLVICDTLARTLTSAEIPIGILSSLLGAPYLFYLLRTRGHSVLG